MECPGGGDGDPHLLQIVRAVRTPSEVSIESTAIGSGEGTLEVLGDQLDYLLADEIIPTTQEHRHLPRSSRSDSRAPRNLLLPRCSRTRWLTSVSPSRSHTSTPESPST